MNISRSILVVGTALAAAVAAPAHAQGFLGQPVQVSVNTGSTVLLNGGTQTITAGGNAFSLSGFGLNALVTPTQITYTATGPESFGTGFTLVASETGVSPATILTLTIDPTTTATGFIPADATFDSKDVFASLGNVAFASAGSKLVLDYTAAAAPVPEASTTVSFGLLLALGMGGLVLAAKRKAASKAA